MIDNKNNAQHVAPLNQTKREVSTLRPMNDKENNLNNQIKPQSFVSTIKSEQNLGKRVNKLEEVQSGLDTVTKMLKPSPGNSKSHLMIVMQFKD